MLPEEDRVMAMDNAPMPAATQLAQHNSTVLQPLSGQPVLAGTPSEELQNFVGASFTA